MVGSSGSIRRKSGYRDSVHEGKLSYGLGEKKRNKKEKYKGKREDMKISLNKNSILESRQTA